MTHTKIMLALLVIASIWAVSITFATVASGAVHEPKVYETEMQGKPAIVIDARESHAPDCILVTTNLMAASVFYTYLIGAMTGDQFVVQMTDALVTGKTFPPARAIEFALQGVKVCQRPRV